MRTIEKRPDNRSTRGFTLVELLVVIGIIGLLISILLPTLGRVRESANRVACAAGLRDIGNLFQMYLNDSKGRVPEMNPLPLKPDVIVPPRPSFFEVFDQYTKGSRKVWICPSDKMIANSGAVPLSPDGRAYDTYADAYGVSYEYNFFMNSFFGGQKFTEAMKKAEERGITANTFRVFNDFTNFHGAKGKVGNMNFLFADWHVGDLGGSNSGQSGSAGGR
jgi:prepilin-type N-terminal cleavage/methylation domain-containing protein/prepilin-type processing-associated H-X9-DG protein